MRLALMIVTVVLVGVALVVTDKLRARQKKRHENESEAEQAEQEREDAPALEYVNTFIATFYIVLLALIVVLLWQNVDDINSDVRAEVSDLKSVNGIAVRLPAAQGVPLQAATKAYATALLRDEWPPPKHSDDTTDPVALALGAMDRVVTAPVTTATSNGTVGDTLRGTIDDLSSYRDDRLAKSREGTPGVLLWSLGVLSLITVITPLALGLRADALAFTGIAVAALLVCLAFLFVLSLETPFSGLVHVDKGPVREFLANP
jgi:hypothetical protein